MAIIFSKKVQLKFHNGIFVGKCNFIFSLVYEAKQWKKEKRKKKEEE